MLRVSRRFLQGVALGISIAALLSTRSVSAQDTLVATARMSARPFTRPGADSGKFIVSVRISGIPEFGLRTLSTVQIVLVDGLGGRYTPFGYSVKPGMQRVGLLAALTAPQAERLVDREYIFFVAPGLMTFELRIAGLKPVRVVPSLTGFR
jgi:hypothetical protein